MKRIEILRGKVAKLVGLLAEKKLTVTQRGTEAYTRYDSRTGKPTLINIPQIPDDASEDLINAIEGYLDHEVGHVLFTDYACMKKTRKSKLLNEIYNAVEDSYVERKMMEKFTGSGYNLDACGSFFTSIIKEHLSGVKDPQQLIGLLLPSAIRAWSGRSSFNDFMKDKWELIQPLVDKIGGYCSKEIPQIENSDGALEVAKVIYDMIADEDEDKSEEPDKNPKEQERGGGEETSDNEDGSDKNDEHQEDKSDTPKSEQDNPDKKEKPEVDKENEEEKKTKTDEGSDQFSDILRKAFTQESKEADKTTDYRVYTTEYDLIDTIKVNYDKADVYARSLETDVNSMLGIVQKKLERAIAAKSLSVWAGGYRSGKLNATALTRYITVGDDRVFKRKHIADTKDTAVTLFVDCSGSMMGRQIEIACQTAYALSSVLDRMNIKNEVLGFTTRKMEIRNAAKASKVKYNWEASRKEPLLTYVFKDFNERMSNEQKLRFGKGAYGDLMMRNNVDGESLMIAVNRLNARPEKRKILIVLSDGIPCALGSVSYSKHLKKTIAEVEKRTNINLVGIGIISDAVSRFYKDHVVIEHINELPTTVMDSVKRILLSK